MFAHTLKYNQPDSQEGIFRIFFLNLNYIFGYKIQVPMSLPLPNERGRSGRLITP